MTTDDTLPTIAHHMPWPVDVSAGRSYGGDLVVRIDLDVAQGGSYALTYMLTLERARDVAYAILAAANEAEARAVAAVAAALDEEDDDDPLGLAAEARVETIVLPAEEGR